ncbi:hypothetical protein DL768_005430 [Monosporascus sp. mg162]|nr:hypothetical protein DL768_005430 [Monosporascus sp. mg162]
MLRRDGSTPLDMRLYHVERASYGGTDHFADDPPAHSARRTGCSLLGYSGPIGSRLGSGFPAETPVRRQESHGEGIWRLRLPELTSPEQDDELALMVDAYDIHPAAARKYPVHEAVDGENLQQLTVFGAGKRCAPNWPHTVACYAIPNLLLYKDLYGGNMDTVMGYNYWSSVCQRFLDSRYVLGPVDAMRRMFAEAWKEIEGWPQTDPFDDGQRFSADVY